MPDTLEALGVVILAILPGALFTWALEREVGQWGIGLSDRFFRFIGVSAVFLALFSWPLHWLWQQFLHRPVETKEGIVFRNVLVEAGPVPWWLFLFPLAYVILPSAAGLLVARGVRKEQRWVRLVVGRDPAPRAWDHVFARRPAALIRLQLKDGRWVGGLFGENSYAAGYPEEPQDLFLELAYRMHDDGSYVVDQAGDYAELGSGILIRWEEVQFLEIFDLEEAE
jgi:Family of unknown function (DUF6338)